METIGETILVADDDPYIGKVLSDRLRSLGYRVVLAANGKQVLEILDRQDPKLALLDIALPDINGIDVLKEIRNRGSDFPVVMVTAYGSIDLAVQAMRDGAYDFITKPFKPDYISMVVQKALEQQGLRRKVEILSEETDKRHHLLTGKSPKMNETIQAARKAAASRATVLLLGESGTGKELFARAIHNWSDRKDRPFVAINCVGLSRELLESELFGHEKGAFTGAQQLKRGKMELAHGGTVLLDEVGDISPEIQTRLLRFLQERELERVGGTESIRVDVRIIAATSRDIAAAIREGRFREDFYYRLNVISITLPPLRERKEDVADLARFFAQRFSQEAKKDCAEITAEAMEKLTAYDWPGNVRELANVIERAVVLGQDHKIRAQDLTPGSAGVRPKTDSECKPYHEAMDSYRRRLIMNALDQTGGNRAAAARVLGIQRTYLSRLLKSLRVN